MEYLRSQILLMNTDEFNRAFYKKNVKVILNDYAEVDGIIEEIGIAANDKSLPVTIKVKEKRINVFKLNKIVLHE